jgi:hypothetical protein
VTRLFHPPKSSKRQAYLDLHSEYLASMSRIALAKNADYTGGADDPFSNFRLVEALGIGSAEQGFLTRMTDKLSRISSFTKQGTLMVKDESVEDTLLDLANYCLLMAAYLKDKQGRL